MWIHTDALSVSTQWQSLKLCSFDGHVGGPQSLVAQERTTEKAELQAGLSL